MSTDYYTRLERGNLAGVSESVLEALAGALQLDEAERTHLFDLADAANASGRRRRSASKQHLRAPASRGSSTPSVRPRTSATTGSTFWG